MFLKMVIYFFLNILTLDQLLLPTEHVMFEFHPVFDKWERDGSDLQRAAIAWLGDEESRPYYIGQGSWPAITPKMDSMLWEYVKTKNMDQKMFRALVRSVTYLL